MAEDLARKTSVSWTTKPIDAPGIMVTALASGGAEVSVSIGSTHISHDLTEEQILDLLAWITEHQKTWRDETIFPKAEEKSTRSRLYSPSKEHPDSGYYVDEIGVNEWVWVWVEPGEEDETSGRNYRSKAEALRGAAEDWESAGEIGGTLSRTLRAAATRLEKQA